MEMTIRFAINNGSMLGDMTTKEVETLVALSRVMPQRDADVTMPSGTGMEYVLSGWVTSWRLVENPRNRRPELEVKITIPEQLLVRIHNKV